VRIRPFNTYLPILIAVLSTWISTGYGQGFRTEFGKNRVQTKEYEWQFFNSDKFDVYYYGQGRSLAVFVQKEAEQHIKEIETFFDFRLEDEITFVLYNSKLDYNQSNMFLQQDAYNVGGTTRIIGSTCFIYFSGDHYEFVKNIRQGIGQVVINEMLYGGSIQERLQNSTLLNLPDWYINGLVNHIAYGWEPDIDSRLRNGMMAGELKNMASLSKSEKDLVSQAIWMYIDKRYGHEAVSNILYISRVNKSMESGYLYVLGKELKDLYDEWYEFTYYNYLNKQTKSFNLPEVQELPKKFNKKKILSDLSVNKDGSKIAITNNDKGKTCLMVYDLNTKEKKKVFTLGYKSDVKDLDLSYPIFSWDARQDVLHYIYEKGGTPFYVIYNVETEKVVRKGPLTQVQKIYSLSPSPDGHSFVISALKNGRVDIMTLDANTFFIRSITNDDYDDHNPIYTNNGKGIVFSTNRPNTAFKSIVKHQNNFDFAPAYDLYYYNVKERANVFVQLTNTPNRSELNPKLLDDGLISYQFNSGGCYNLGVLERQKVNEGVMAIRKMKNSLISENDTFYFASVEELDVFLGNRNDSSWSNVASVDTSSIQRDTSIQFQMTQFGENVEDYEIAPGKRIYHLSLDDNKYNLYSFTYSNEILFDHPLMATEAFEYLQPLIKLKEEEEEEALTQVEEELDSFKYTFITGFEDLETGPVSKAKQENVPGTENKGLILKASKDNKKEKAAYYYLSFAPDQIITQFDVGYFNTPYLPYTQGDNSINAQGLRGLSRVAISDMFKDYRIEAGARPSINLNGLEYFGRYQNLKGRLDKDIFYFRSGNETLTDTGAYKQVTQELRLGLGYPFSEVSGMKLEVFGREDHWTGLAQSRDALEESPTINYWLGGKLSFTYDNTIQDGVNILYGTRAKFYYEHYNGINRNVMLNIIGGDIRHYQKIHRVFIWANRLAFASSMGKDKVVYFLGGTENWMVPRFNRDINVDEEINYVYKSAAVNLRGFNQNIRNGGSYAVFNSELRLPLFRFFSTKPLKSSFLENFQIIGFGDAGVAFNGYSPFSEDNAFNKKIFENGPVTIERWSLREPIVGGYGFGLRSNIMGYFVRFDWAWGVESGIEPERMFYLSLGTDF